MAIGDHVRPIDIMTSEQSYGSMLAANDTSARRQDFACPIHKTPLSADFRCGQCELRFPVINGVPVLLNESNSVFRTKDYLEINSAYGGASAYAGHLDKVTGLRQLYRRFVYRLGEGNLPKREFDTSAAIDHILKAQPAARILIIGAGDTVFPGNVTYTDVAFGKHVTCIADAHDLPFLDCSFDACIACAVLEHVVDPQRCVAEIIRVLQPGGYVYAETPFMQPVHMGAHDFTRFTYLGHRRLFRQFDEIQSGMCGGPGTSAGWVLRQAIGATSSRPAVIKILKLIGLLITYPFRWIDHLTWAKLGAYDSASAFYFFGTLRPQPISDRDILKYYRGG